MHMHMVLACPTLTPQSHRNPGSAKSAEASVGDFSSTMQQESLAMIKRFFPVLGKLWVWKRRKGQGKNPFFLKMRQWWPPQHKGGVRKSAFPML